MMLEAIVDHCDSRLALCNADFQKAMAILDDVMVQYHDTLKKLADS